MELSRRRFMCSCGAVFALAGCGGGGDAAPASSSPPRQEPLQIAGCSYIATAGGGPLPGCGTSKTSGNAEVDRLFGTEFGRQTGFFGLPQVSFSFMDDCDGPNAVALSQTKEIWFGLRLTEKTYMDYGILALWSIMAHEFGHQVQYAFGADSLRRLDDTVKPTELEADMFAGFYLIHAYADVPFPEMKAAMQQLYKIGDFDFNSPQHHGTPDERITAFVGGAVVGGSVRVGNIPNTYDAVRTEFFKLLQPLLAGRVDVRPS